MWVAFFHNYTRTFLYIYIYISFTQLLGGLSTPPLSFLHLLTPFRRGALFQIMHARASWMKLSRLAGIEPNCEKLCLAYCPASHCNHRFKKELPFQN